MVDIHSHILFGTDDGAENIEESIKLLRQAESAGYTDIVCSSHYYVGKYENKNYEKNFAELKKRIEEEKINIKIYKGNEFALSERYFFHEKNIFRINDSRYLLVELRAVVIYPICRDFFKELIKRGIVPVFAHVERYPYIKVEEFKELRNMGVILQMNLKTAADMSPKMKYMTERGYIGVIATDSHRVGRRDYNTPHYLEKAKKDIGSKLFHLLTEVNPRKILNNEEIEIKNTEGESYEEKNNRNNSFFSCLWNKLFR